MILTDGQLHLLRKYLMIYNNSILLFFRNRLVLHSLPTKLINKCIAELLTCFEEAGANDDKVILSKLSPWTTILTTDRKLFNRIGSAFH